MASQTVSMAFCNLIGLQKKYHLELHRIWTVCFSYSSPYILQCYRQQWEMVQPQLYKDSVVVINPQMADKASIDSLKLALAYNVTDGLGQPAKSDKTTVAGKQGTIIVSTDNGNTMYAVEFCGYFPTGNPKYSVIVSINKTGLPASGGLMAGDVFRKIVNNIIENNHYDKQNSIYSNGLLLGTKRTNNNYK